MLQLTVQLLKFVPDEIPEFKVFDYESPDYTFLLQFLVFLSPLHLEPFLHSSQLLIIIPRLTSPLLIIAAELIAFF